MISMKKRTKTWVSSPQSDEKNNTKMIKNELNLSLIDIEKLILDLKRSLEI